MQLRAMQLCAMYRDFLQPRKGFNGSADLFHTKYHFHRHRKSIIFLKTKTPKPLRVFGLFCACLPLLTAAPVQTRQCAKKPRLSPRLLVGRDDKIRTCDPLHPMQVRYRAALHPDVFLFSGICDTFCRRHGIGSPVKGLQN